MKQFVYAALIGASMAADEILGGGVACEAGKQSVVLYDDAACATASDDQSSASNYVDVLSNPD